MSQPTTAFHFPPATQKTVITTTTTTTLNFPPLLIPQTQTQTNNNNNNDINLDQFPLAEATIPEDWTQRGLPLVFGNGSFAKFNPALSPSLPTASPSPSTHINPSNNSSSTTTTTTTTTTSSNNLNHPSRKRTTTSPQAPTNPTTNSSPPPSRSKKPKLEHTNQFYEPPSHLLPDHMQITPPDSTENLNNNHHHHHHQANNATTPLATVHPLQAANAHLELATSLSLPNLTAEFSRLPVALQQFTLFNLLKRSRLPVLQFVQQMIGPALKRDFICDSPPEIAVLILSKLDGTTLCRASAVSRTWYNMINNSRSIWKHRLKAENLWIGDGSEEIDAEECALVERGSKHWEISRFSRLWKAGVWNNPSSGSSPSSSSSSSAYQNQRLDKIGPARSSSIHPLYSDPSSSSSSLAVHNQSQPSISSSSDQESTIGDNQSDIKNNILSGSDSFKLLYRRRFLTRRNWMKKEPRRITFQGHALTVVTCIQFDWSKMVAASDDNVVHSYDLRTGRRLQNFIGHQGGVWALQYVGDTLVTGSTDRTVRVWNMRTGRNTHVFHGHTSTVRCLQIVEPVNVNPKTNEAPIWEPAHPVIVTGSRDYTLRVWKLPSETDEDYVGCPTPGSPDEIGPAASDTNSGNRFHLHFLRGHNHAVRALAAKGRTMVSGSYDCTVRAWDIMTGKCTQVMRGHQQKIYSVVLDGSRGRCASGSMDNTVRLWDLSTGETIRILGEHSSLVGLLGLSPRRLVSAAADATLRVWDPSTGACRYELKGHLGAITCFTHDEFRVVSGADGTLKLWNGENGVLVGDLLAGFSAVWQVSMDERFCVVAVQRGTESEYVVLDFGRSDGKVDREEPREEEPREEEPHEELREPSPPIPPIAPIPRHLRHLRHLHHNHRPISGEHAFLLYPDQHEVDHTPIEDLD
ncbi:F-box and WD-40 domain-containing protein CDC4 [Puccinia graminis f. sp. tritici CRL 75-36-700-3]|uniref:F-box and WD-40 domain-containing protein CDC4 n=1 Tax=Puccinia graminis f. sp. tritici (strain CRL 75-36-700-3 / race SCCL) TaxID=418459 RepID=E3K383_PUCGT|nr:F-box and WD-40 domain-containing protein CDC4 [Puccinia graminis f. sp. tritici CRL 75-36-700-3]EFP78940.1 F-box and WD-40 domain-containing protein CDC4 [Puccinia graminis f. sp. tritici CRL 75-36-700-3]